MDTYEEKYKEIVGQIRKAYLYAQTDSTKAVLEEIFPELKENEDEKILVIIKHCIECRYRKTSTIQGISMEQCFAWLERQGEHANFRNKIQVGDKVTRNEDGVLVNLSQLNRVAKTSEKQGEQKASYTTIVKTGDGGINALVTRDLPTDGEQKPADKVEPKFKVGDFIVNDYCMGRVVEITNDAYLLDTEQGIPFSCHSTRLWDVTKDAKNGDVLVDSCADFENPLIFILKKFEHKDFGLAKLSDYSSYCFLTMSNKQDFEEGSYHHIHNIHPATKEQRDTLMKAMVDAGYTFDFERKELKKIEDEEYNGEDYGIDSLYHAQRILEKTLGKVDGYQTDDGILSHKCAITAVKKLYEQKHVWSEEDEKFFKTALWHISYSISNGKSTDIHCDTTEWLKSLKDRVGCEANYTTTKEWSEEDERNLQGVIDEIEANKNQAPDYDLATYDRFLSWLKSLKGRVQPKVELTQWDKNILEAAIAFVEKNNHFNYWGGVDKQTVLSALRSLRSQK